MLTFVTFYLNTVSDNYEKMTKYLYTFLGYIGNFGFGPIFK